MAYTTADARQQLLDTLAEAIDQIAVALASLGEAYEQLDEQKAETLEQELFRPVQTAYGRAKRTHAEFARRHGLPARPIEGGEEELQAGLQDVRSLIGELLGRTHQLLRTLGR